MDEESYRLELRNHFMGQMKNSKLQTQYYKDQAARTQQKMHEYDSSNFKAQSRVTAQPQSNSSGGDADRALFENSYNAESYRRANESNFMRQLHAKANKVQTPTLPSPVVPHKYEPPSYDMYDTDSNLGGGCAGSEESSKSQKSSKTVMSKKSSQDLRKMVKSQCKLHEVIDETLKQMCSTDGDPMSEDIAHMKDQTMQAAHHCKRCVDKIQEHSSSRDVTTEIAKGDFLECRSGDTLTISVDDVVNSKVINPMIRKLQRMYLNNLREEMSLMEDLERLPHKVNEVYKATIFKQKD